MEGFREVGETNFESFSGRMVREFARAVSGGGLAADAAEINRAGKTQAQSVAELERDVAVLTPRWSGEDATESYNVIRRFTAVSYQVGPEVTRTVRQLEDLSDAATKTNQRFSNIADGGLDQGESCDSTDRTNESIGASRARELRATYTVPVQGSASELPLPAKTVPVSFNGGGPEGLSPRSAGGGLPDTSGGLGGSGGSSGAGPGGGPSDTPAGTGPGDDPDGDQLAAGGPEGTGTPQGTSFGTPSAGTGSSPTSAGGATEPGSGLPGDTGTGLTDPSSTTPSSYETDGAAATPLLTPAGGLSGRTSGGGAGAVRTAGLGTSASPLGLRPDGAALRGGVAPAAAASASTTGARSSSMPMGGMGPGAAGGQRGQGDGRHRTPGYLIDRANGEELVGGLPLVGPGVIGEWRADGAKDPVRRPEPPAGGGPRRT